MSKNIISIMEIYTANIQTKIELLLRKKLVSLRFSYLGELISLA